MVSFTADGIFVSGRRSNPVRGGVWLGFRLVVATLSLATFLSAIFTCIGINWRACVVTKVAGGSCDGTWVWFGPLFAVPMLLFGSWVVRRMARRFIEPAVGELVPWASLQTVATDGRGIDIAATGRFGGFRARLAPKGRRELQLLLAAIREKRLPGGRGSESGSMIRPPWLDRGAALIVLGLTVRGGVIAEPWATGSALADGRGRAAGFRAIVELAESLREDHVVTHEEWGALRVEAVEHLLGRGLRTRLGLADLLAGMPAAS